MHKMLASSAIVALCQMALASAGSYGPNDCVSVSRSPAGTCVISTECQDQDTSQVEFAFNCEDDEVEDEADEVRTKVTWHSYGVGGFDAKEDFDTEVHCTRCAKPDLKSPKAIVEVEQAPEDEETEEELPMRPAPTKAPRLRASRGAKVREDPTPARRVEESDEEQESSEDSDEVVPASADAVPGTVSAVAERQAPGAATTTPMNAVLIVPTTSVQVTTPPVIQVDVDDAAAAAENDLSDMAKDISKSLSMDSDGGSSVTFGPDNCVKVYRSSAGHCIMQTKCTGSYMEGYEYGLVCADEHGKPTRHMFGQNSFSPEETFDTLIQCDQCLGLEEIPKDMALAGEVHSIEKDVESLKADLTSIKGSLGISPTAPPPAPAAPAAGAAPVFLKAAGHKLAHTKRRYVAKGTHRKGHHHRHGPRGTHRHNVVAQEHISRRKRNLRHAAHGKRPHHHHNQEVDTENRDRNDSDSDGIDNAAE